MIEEDGEEQMYPLLFKILDLFPSHFPGIAIMYAIFKDVYALCGTLCCNVN